MTEVFFYTHADNKMQTACTLTIKALARGMRVMLLTPDAAQTERLSKLIWSAPATGFVPHCRSSDRLAPVTPIIVDHVAEPLVHDQVLVNLCDRPPRFSAVFSGWWKSSAPKMPIAKPRGRAFASTVIAATKSARISSEGPLRNGRGNPPRTGTDPGGQPAR